MEILSWIGIGVCIVHSAIFSGLNLALFGLTRLRLEVEVSSGNRDAARIMSLREDAHLLLTTILWGNVAFNTLLAILSNSLLIGVWAFLFSTVFITFFGEIIPQAYFSKHALRMGAALTPVLQFYQLLLYPVAKPTALLLDYWLGQQGINYFREHQLREVIKKHIEAEDVDVDILEGMGALNFLALDDLPVVKEGEPLVPESVISLPLENGEIQFPPIGRSADDPFLQRVNRSGEKWVVITDRENEPQLLLDADGFLRNALFGDRPCNPTEFCHVPLIVRSEITALGDVLSQFIVHPEEPGDDVIDQDIILLWGRQRRVITGADILGRLLRGIVIRDSHTPYDSAVDDY